MKIRKQIDGKWFYSLNDGKSFEEDPDQTPEGTSSPAALTPEEQAEKDAADKAAADAKAGGDGGEKGITAEELEKAAVSVAKHIADYQAIREEGLKKKAAVIPGRANIVDADVKIYTNRKGEDVTMKSSQANLVAGWFQSFLKHKVRHEPDAFYKMQDYARKLNALDSATAGDGGNLIPVVLSNVLIPLIEDMSVVRPNAQGVDMSNVKTLDIPTVAGKPVVSIAGESLQKASSSMQFGKVTLAVETLAAIVPITNQLIDFASFDVVRILSQALAESIAKAEDQLFMTGTGTSQPKGLDAYTFAKTIDAGGLLSWTHLNAAYFGVTQYFRNRGVWLMGSEEMSYLANLKDSQNRPIFDVAGVFQAEGLPTIKGRPVYEQNYTGGKIFFGDLKSYWVGASRNIRIDIADQATVRGQSLWERNMIAIRAEEYVDGRLGDTRAFAEINNA